MSGICDISQFAKNVIGSIKIKNILRVGKLFLQPDVQYSMTIRFIAFLSLFCNTIQSKFIPHLKLIPTISTFMWSLFSVSAISCFEVGISHLFWLLVTTEQ